jgi:anti-sigma-K factor RskA
MNTVIIRKTFTEKKNNIEQKLVTLADLAILVERLKEQLHDCDNGKQRAMILSELRHARFAHKAAMQRVA